MEIITTERLPIYNWAKDIEDGAMQQAKNLANHPVVTGRVCLMPDGHEGFGMPIGGVIATRNAIIPNAVGVDIGCSMSAYNTFIKIDSLSQQQIKDIADDIKATIPVGFAHRKEIHPLVEDDDLFKAETKTSCDIFKKERESAMHQIGTLGGGNHFIELQTDGEYLWLMIHTGSRNLGKKVCDHYNNIANEICEAAGYKDIVKQQLAFLPKDSEQMTAYINEMRLCMDFAHLNHIAIRYDIDAIITGHCSENAYLQKRIYYTTHNYADVEQNGEGDITVIHRKGAVDATYNSIIILGSQGTASYICEGLGNKHSYCSASHGAGRKMSRTQAKETLDLAEVQAQMDALGIYHNIHNKSQLDEAAAAYKDIEEVLSLEADLVTPKIKLTPLAVIKG